MKGSLLLFGLFLLVINSTGCRTLYLKNDNLSDEPGIRLPVEREEIARRFGTPVIKYEKKEIEPYDYSKAPEQSAKKSNCIELPVIFGMEYFLESFNVTGLYFFW